MKRVTRTSKDVHRGGRGRRDRDCGERQPGRLLLAVVGMGRARIPRADVRPPHPRRARRPVACASLSRARWSRSGYGSLSRRCGRSARQRRFERSSACSCTSRSRSLSRWSSGAVTGRRCSQASRSASRWSARTRSPRGSFPTASTPSTTRSTRTDWLRRSGTGTRSGCWRCWACWPRSASLLTQGVHRSHSPPQRRFRSSSMTLYFTFSRGAWGALTVGFVAAVALDPRRIRLLWTSLLVGLPSAACIAYASTFEALTSENARAAAAERAGHRVAVAVCVAIAASVLAAWLARWVSRRVEVSARGRRRFDRCARLVRGPDRGRRARRRGRPARCVPRRPESLQRRDHGRRSRPQQAPLQRLRERPQRAASRRLERRPRASAARQRRRERSSTSGTRTTGSPHRARRALALHGDVRRARRRGSRRARRRAAGPRHRSDPCAADAVHRSGVRGVRRLVGGGGRRLALGDGRCDAHRPPCRLDRARGCGEGCSAPASRRSCSAGADRGLRPPQRLRGLEPRRQPGAVRGPRGARAQGLGGSARRTRVARVRSSSGQPSRSSSWATLPPGSATVRRRCGSTATPSRPTRATGSPGSASRRWRAAPSAWPPTGACASSTLARRASRASDVPRPG